jgi:hypothetical protein
MRIRSLIRGLPTLLAISLVVVAYAFFASGGSFRFREIHSADATLYASLTAGLLHGHLYLASQPDPGLVALANPYDPQARIGIPYLWDASYRHGRYYIYFSPLPVLLFYLPYRVALGAYPPDALVGLLFCLWAFLAALGFTQRALVASDDPLHLPFVIWVLFIGFGGITPFLLAEIRTYEVSIMAGSAMTASWAYALCGFVKKPTTRSVMWTSLWLALSIAARPNVGVLLLPTSVLVAVTSRDRLSRRRYVVTALIPLAVIGCAMLAYNTARFQRPFEFGHSYQLTGVSMLGRSVCGVCNLAEAARFANSALHYVFLPLTIRSDFPFVQLLYTSLDPKVSFPASEQAVGLAPLVPLALFGTCRAILLCLQSTGTDPGCRAAMYVVAAGWLILVGLCACWFVAVRYELDFMVLIMAATTVLVERGSAHFRASGLRLLCLRLGVGVLAWYSIFVGFTLGFVGREDAFRRFHPDIFEHVSRWITHIH